MYQFRLDDAERQWLSKVEDMVDDCLRYTRHYLPAIARLFLLSTFIEDGWRMLVQWNDQLAFFQESWGFPWLLGMILVFHGSFGQLLPSIMILIRKKVVSAILVLTSVLVCQTILFRMLSNPVFFVRNVSVTGALVFLLAEHFKEPESTFAGVPKVKTVNQQSKYMMLIGRVSLALMYMTLIKFDFKFFQLIHLGISFLLMLCVILGYRTRLSAFFVAILLFICNFYQNPWWNEHQTLFSRDFMKYDFFQTLSAVGGLLLVIAHGPGGVSYDDYKKQW